MVYWAMQLDLVSARDQCDKLDLLGHGGGQEKRFNLISI